MYNLCGENKGAVTAQRSAPLFFAYAKNQFSHEAAHIACHFIDEFEPLVMTPSFQTGMGKQLRPRSECSYGNNVYKIPLHKNISKTVVKTCEDDSCCKSESRVLHKWLKSHITKVIDFSFGRYKD